MKNLKYNLLRRWMVNFLMIFLLFFCSNCNAQPSHGKYLLAISKRDHKLAVVDPVSLKVIARIPIGSDPHEVIASSDGKTAYVSIYGGGSLHTLNEIDLVSLKPIRDIDTRPLFGPHGLTFVNGKVWFTAEGSKAVGRYDPATGKLDWSMGTGQDRTHMIYVTNNAQKIYATNVASGTLSILENMPRRQGNFGPPRNVGNKNMPPPGGQSHENWEQTIIPTSNGAEGFDVSPDSTELWTAAAEEGTLFIIDLNAKKVSAKIDAKLFGANRLKFTPDGKQVFISSLGSGDLVIYDAKTHAEVKRVNIGHGAAGIIMDPLSSRAFVACSPDNYIAVIDLNTLKIIGKIDVGGEPDGLAFATRQ